MGSIQGQADILRNNSYRTSILQLENSFLEDLVKILKWSISVRDVYAEALLLDSVYKSDIKSGKLVEGSPDATVRYAEIEMKNKEAEQMLSSSETEFHAFQAPHFQSASVGATPLRSSQRQRTRG